MQGYIYKITNKINSHAYIGKTINNPNYRWRKHQWDSNRSDRVFCRAIKKYGPDNFIVETLEVCAIESLSEREEYYIDLHGTYRDGYNMIPDSTPIYDKPLKPVVQLDLKGNFIARFESIKAAESSTGIDRSKICVVCQNKRLSAKGYIWVYAGNYDENKDYSIGDKRMLKKRKKVAQKTFAGDTIEIHKSVTHAARNTGLERANITAACKGRLTQTGGYKWEFSK